MVFLVGIGNGNSVNFDSGRLVFEIGVVVSGAHLHNMKCLAPTSLPTYLGHTSVCMVYR